METVELHQAFQWDCPTCGRENFTRTVTADLTPEEKKEWMVSADVPLVGLMAKRIK